MTDSSLIALFRRHSLHNITKHLFNYHGSTSALFTPPETSKNDFGTVPIPLVRSQLEEL
jgi:hypothetical protein